MENDKFNHIYKIVLIGDAGVGKTHLLNRYVRKSLPNRIIPTIGVEFATMQIQLKSGETIKTQLWDTAGQERYRAITSAHYKRAVGAILVYDVTNNRTFENVKKWLEEVRENADQQIVLALLGNKVDLAENNPQQRKVTLDYGRKFATDELLFFREISAFDQQKVESFFQDFFEVIYENLNAVYTETEQSQFDDNESKLFNSKYSQMENNLQRQSERNVERKTERQTERKTQRKTEQFQQQQNKNNQSQNKDGVIKLNVQKKSTNQQQLNNQKEESNFGDCCN